MADRIEDTGDEEQPTERCTCGAAGGALRQFQEDLGNAMRQPEDSGPPMQRVELKTDQGTELLLYGPGPEFQDAGVLVIPAELDEPGS
ncbi:hypothetical protein [Streptomyces sp. TRM68367]|uniref:hypothetical protein n=1 Tax=Streptomyces sp. TRM68367 TaxID=2758415 RepID=UPI00165C9060|nr:hypothetical protein [Streptomyces sp. TRM68367]MBC9729278.1 hypothetical protein [Streptomyces sp. TRM68367]